MHRHSTELVEALRSPAAYPWQPDRVDLIETHVSWVYLAGDRVVKVKRPVRYEFVDHRAVGRRRHSCQEEVRLNRRLSEGVYLGTVPITREGTAFRVGGSGRPVEWATLMRRLPAERMLDVLIGAGNAPENLAAVLAERLIPFHRDSAAPCGTLDHDPDRSTAVVIENLAELRPFAGHRLGRRQLELVTESLVAFAKDHRALLADRVSQGWIREGHGDLRAEHICIEPAGIQVFDCVEFSPSIRCADVASDLAYLVMDLRRLGMKQAASDLVTRYRESGIELPDPLLRFYQAHRALVRAKIACLRMRGGVQSHPSASREASRYLELAAGVALTFRPFLVVMTGLSGTGKSTVAEALSRSSDALLVSSDVVRKQLAEISGPASGAYGEGIYAPEWTRQTYEELLRIGGETVASGRPVILDASFLDHAWRVRATTLGQNLGVPVFVVETVADPEIAEWRILARAERGGSASDASVDIYRHQRTMYRADKPGNLAGARWIRVETDRDATDAVGSVLAALVESGAVRPRIAMA